MYRYKGKQHLQANIDSLRRLVELITAGDNEGVQRLLQQFSHVNEIDSETGKTPLMLACELGRLEIVQLLLDAGAEANLEDFDSWSALIYALKDSHQEIAHLLINNDASLVHMDKNKWTPLIWACYLDLHSTVELMLNKGAVMEHKDAYGVSCLSWAAGRGNTRVVDILIKHHNSSRNFINASDKYGTTPLLWACRKGFIDAARLLLEAGADVDMIGMSGWSPLIASCLVGNQRLVDLLLSHYPQLDASDKSGMTALMIAAKSGHVEITDALIEAKASVNKLDSHGDSALIHGCRNGHLDVVALLINQGADVDQTGSDNKCPLLIAIEKDYTEIALLLINDGQAKVNAPRTENGETCLLKATKKANITLVEALLDNNANVFACDNDGNTAIHLSVKGRMSSITELLLSNPKHGRILYMPNKAGETPYNMDARQNDGKVLNQVFGARRFLPDEDENHRLLGYHLYSASLADFFSEPMLQLPITLGLFAKWGSGKSHFLPRLEEDMKSFCQTQPPSHQARKRWMVYILLFCLGAIIAAFGAFFPLRDTRAWHILLICIGVSVGCLLPAVTELLRLLSIRSDYAHSITLKMDSYVLYVYLLLCILFKRPPNRAKGQQPEPHAIRYLFTDRSRVSGVGGEAAIAKLVASLVASAEAEFGFLATRLFLASLSTASLSSSRFKLTLCFPSFLFAIAFLACSVALGFVLMLCDAKVYFTPIIVLGGLLILIVAIHTRAIFNVVLHLYRSQFRKVMTLSDKCSTMPEGKYVQQLKREVETLSKVVNGIDDFAHYSTRMVVFVDGLDSCEQEKVLRVLETVTILFCYPNMPFIVVYCLDPAIIIKSIEQHIQSQFRNENVKSYEYMRTIVHLPFYFPDLSKESHSLQVWEQLPIETPCEAAAAVDTSPISTHTRQFKVSFNQISSPPPSSSHRTLMARASTVTKQSVLSTWNLNKMLNAERDSLTDLNPREMQRLINIISVAGRLMRADHIPFDWKKLALWIHLTEKWAYHISWIIHFLLMNIKEYNRSTSLKEVYDELRPLMPAVKDDVKFEQDAERRLLEVFLNYQTPQLVLGDIKSFFPYSINLDPSLKVYVDNHAGDTPITDKNTMSTGIMVQKPPPPPPGVLLPDGRSMFPFSPHAILSAGLSATLRGEEHNRDREPKLTQQVLASYENAKPLSGYSLEEICSQLNCIQGIDESRVPEYQSILRGQNINGNVLSCCDMEELKCYMNMTFGDWNLFKQWVYTKRLLENDEAADTTVTSRSLNEDDDHHQQNCSGINSSIPEHCSSSPQDTEQEEQRDQVRASLSAESTTVTHDNTSSLTSAPANTHPFTTPSQTRRRMGSLAAEPVNDNPRDSVSQIFEQDFLGEPSTSYKAPGHISPSRFPSFMRKRGDIQSSSVAGPSSRRGMMQRTMSHDGADVRRSFSATSKRYSYSHAPRSESECISVDNGSIKKFTSHESLISKVRSGRPTFLRSILRSRSRRDVTAAADEVEPLSQTDPAEMTAAETTFHSVEPADIHNTNV